MLRELSVQNLALIEDVRVELAEGFCAWTGETGAGKTLLLAALGLLLGERGSTELLRAGAEELRIAGRFEISARRRGDVAELLHTPLEEDELIVARRLNRAGRSFAYVNEQPVAIGTLRQLGSLLVDVHGQRESLSLLEPSYQLQLLDAFADLEGVRQQYQHLAEQLRGLRARHAAMTAERQERQRDLALLRFEREELKLAQLRPGELAELSRHRDRLGHAQGLQTFAASASERLYDNDGSIVEQLGKLHREAQSWVAHDPDLHEIAGRLQGLVAETSDLAELLRLLQERYEADPARLEEIEARIQQLRRLETKYGRSMDELLAYERTLDTREGDLEQQESDLSSVEANAIATFAQLRHSAAELSKQRQRAAKRLAAAVQRELADLGMADAALDVQLEPRPLGEDPFTGEVPPRGTDQLEFMLSANRGEPARPLRKVASGGELSRTMLAIQSVLASHDPIGTLIFDEIDANVGGRLGDTLGQKLAALGQTHQVICVTHLPQVACFATHQWTIRKRRRGGRTTTSIELLKEDERLEELASMLRGEARGETTRQEAAAMLTAARKRRAGV